MTKFADMRFHHTQLENRMSVPTGLLGQQLLPLLAPEKGLTMRSWRAVIQPAIPEYITPYGSYSCRTEASRDRFPLKYHAEALSSST